MPLQRGRRASDGPRSKRCEGITLAGPDDAIVGVLAIDNQRSNVLIVSQNGFGKRSLLEDYRITHRGGKGISTIKITEKTGNLVALKDVTDDDDLMIINRSGIAIRLHVDTLRILGRNTQGVKLIDLRKNDTIAAVCVVPRQDDEEEEFDEEMVIVRRKQVELTPMVAEEAILQMEMLGHDFFVFLDMDTDDVSVVYKRKGNAYGLIETKR